MHHYTLQNMYTGEAIDLGVITFDEALEFARKQANIDIVYYIRSNLDLENGVCILDFGSYSWFLIEKG